MATVLLGNTSPKSTALGTSVSVNGEQVPEDRDQKLPAQTVVIIDTPDIDSEGKKISLDKKLGEIRNAFALHSDESAAWVEGVDADFTKTVSQVFDCEVGRPKGWDPVEKPTEKAQEPSSSSSKRKSAQVVKDVRVEAEDVSEHTNNMVHEGGPVETDPDDGMVN